MKTFLPLGLAAIGLSVGTLQAQRIVVAGGTAYYPQPQPPTAVTSAPVSEYLVAQGNPSPVIVQVIIAPPASPVGCPQPPVPCVQTPVVYYPPAPVCSGYSEYRYYPRSPVIYFGAGQGYRQGYHFSHRR